VIRRDKGSGVIRGQIPFQGKGNESNNAGKPSFGC
jgi:hypothetical protein